MRKTFRINLPDGRTLELGKRTLVVGVLNVTPDSFSDGGRHFETAGAVDRALRMEADGADIIEVGGESTRPGSEPIAAAEELNRITPVLKEIAKRVAIPVAVDTCKSEVGRAAV